MFVISARVTKVGRTYEKGAHISRYIYYVQMMEVGKRLKVQYPFVHLCLSLLNVCEYGMLLHMTGLSKWVSGVLRLIGKSSNANNEFHIG